MFDPESFIEECRAAVEADPSHRAVLAVVRQAIDDPAAIIDSLGAPAGAGIFPLYRSAELTILNVVWKPGMTLTPHDHAMWAVIGVYAGREDNVFWRRVPGDPDGRLEPAGERTLLTGDVMPLGRDIIHSVTNPLSEPTGAIHVYGGDFFGVERSEWEADALVERPWDIERVRALFRV
jgi:predicted metal-dependent enzyme (double-stranded beta helix superfamily)